jgi:hypothetical protein
LKECIEMSAISPVPDVEDTPITGLNAAAVDLVVTAPLVKVARSTLEKVWRRKRGSAPPAHGEKTDSIPLGETIAWAVTSAVVVAVVRTLVWRGVIRLKRRREAQTS